MWRHVNSLQHPLVKHFVKLREQRSYRYECQSLMIEGVKLVAEMAVTTHFKCVVSMDEALLPKGMQADEVILVDESVMHKISGMQTPEGIMAEIAMPKPASLQGMRYVVAFDALAEPGNLGTLLRTALALGWEGAFMLENSCDPFNEKAMRAARGATFRLPLAWGNWEQLKQLIRDNALTPVVADLHGENLGEVQLPGNILLVLGNEARGVSAQAKAVCKAVTIPMPGEMESLNVSIAGGIMMYVLGKK